jgi:hypothetical protein
MSSPVLPAFSGLRILSWITYTVLDCISSPIDYLPCLDYLLYPLHNYLSSRTALPLLDYLPFLDYVVRILSWTTCPVLDCVSTHRQPALSWNKSGPLLDYLLCPGLRDLPIETFPALDYKCFSAGLPAILCTTTSVPLLDYLPCPGIQVFLCWTICPARDYKCYSAGLPALPWTTSVPLLD